MHDFALDAHHFVFLDLPVVFDAAQAAMGDPPWRWDGAHRARFGVLPRSGETTHVRWFDIAPCCIWHTMNAFETDGDDRPHRRPPLALWRQEAQDLDGGPALHRWTPPGTGKAAETPLDATRRIPPHRGHRTGLPIATATPPPSPSTPSPATPRSTSAT
ncbi:hypothetical protein CP973_15875 [Streptomyces albofaciens JCM 4342]|uniref:carotenoid oxygenase family protein n=1 Tax=Streptomyces albofaciens TaxID=66866 RepID=UPI001238EE81|nr:hypothetical protein CP973_15875 [Streptomyces albofaciens JCM 4342]